MRKLGPLLPAPRKVVLIPESRCGVRLGRCVGDRPLDTEPGLLASKLVPGLKARGLSIGALAVSGGGSLCTLTPAPGPLPEEVRVPLQPLPPGQERTPPQWTEGEGVWEEGAGRPGGLQWHLLLLSENPAPESCAGRGLRSWLGLALEEDGITG